MIRQFVMGAGLACAGLALAGCSQDRPVIVLPPADLATCLPEPEAPEIPARDGTTETQDKRDVLTLDYILNLRTWGGDCASKVAGLAEWRAAAGN